MRCTWHCCQDDAAPEWILCAYHLGLERKWRNGNVLIFARTNAVITPPRRAKVSKVELRRIGDLKVGDTIDGSTILKGPFPAKDLVIAEKGWVYFELEKNGRVTKRAVYHKDHKVPR